MPKSGDFGGVIPQFELYRKGLPGVRAKVETHFGHEGALYCENIFDCVRIIIDPSTPAEFPKAQLDESLATGLLSFCQILPKYNYDHNADLSLTKFIFKGFFWRHQQY
jgi:hypothetical protein